MNEGLTKIAEDLTQTTSFFSLDKVKDFLLNFGMDIINAIVLTTLILIFAKILILMVNKIITKALSAKNASKQRIETIIGMIDNLVKYVIGIVIFIIILVAFGVPWESLMAGAGILGIIVGLGAQELISDTVNGFFVIFEGTFEVGEYIQVNEFEGFVVDLGIKSTVIETYENKKITIPNSKIQEVVNYSKNNYDTFYYFGVSYDVKLKDMVQIINKQIIPEVTNLEEVKKVSYIGLNEFQDSAITYGLCITTAPEVRFSMKRNVNAIIKEVLDENNIEIPYQNITISYKEEE